MLKAPSQNGFSLIELLLVVVIIGLLAAVAVPSLLKSRQAAEKGSTVAVLRTIHSDQLIYFSQRGRYARLDELNSYFGNSLGTTQRTVIYRGSYLFQMSPTPTDATLASRYQVIVYRADKRLSIPVFLMAQDGTINALMP